MNSRIGLKQAERAERIEAASEATGDGGLWSYERYTETPATRRARIARRTVDPETAAALRRLWGMK